MSLNQDIRVTIVSLGEGFTQELRECNLLCVERSWIFKDMFLFVVCTSLTFKKKIPCHNRTTMLMKRWYIVFRIAKMD